MTAQMLDGRLERIEAIVERQQRMPPESDDDRLLLDGKDGRLGFPGTCREIGDSLALLPLRDSLLVDPMALGERSQALLTILYCSTDRLRRGGAAVQNLSHSASFESCDKNAPSKPGTKHLIPTARNC